MSALKRRVPSPWTPWPHIPTVSGIMWLYIRTQSARHGGIAQRPCALAALHGGIQFPAFHALLLQAPRLPCDDPSVGSRTSIIQASVAPSQQLPSAILPHGAIVASFSAVCMLSSSRSRHGRAATGHRSNVWTVQHQIDIVPDRGSP